MLKVPSFGPPFTRGAWLALAAVLLLASCGGGAGTDKQPTPRPSNVTYRVLAGELTSLHQLVQIQVVEDGKVAAEPVTDATVTVNGEPLSLNETESAYRGTLSTPLGAGDALDLHIEVGDSEISGSTTVPATPRIVEPANLEHFLPGEPVKVNWTIDSDPDRFLLNVSNSKGSRTFQIDDGATRSFELPDHVLIEDGTPIRINVFALIDGELTGPVHEGSRISARQQTDPATIPTITVGETPPTLTYRLYSQGITLSQRQRVVIHRALNGVVDGANPVSDATVTLNGTPLTIDETGYWYSGDLPGVPSPGDPLELRVTVGGEDITVTGTFPSPPSITTPTNGAHFRPGESIEVAWSSGLLPERYRVNLSWAGGSRNFTVPDGSVTNATVPEDLVELLPTDSTAITLWVEAINDVAFTGPAHPDSMLILSAAPTVWPKITIGADPPTMTYLVSARSTGVNQSVYIYGALGGVVDYGTTVTDAVVSVNDTPLSYNAATGSYHGNLPTPPAPGDDVVLKVLVGGEEIIGTGRRPTATQLTAPADGAHFRPGDPIALEWTDATSPAKYDFGFTWSGGSVYLGDVDGAARRVDVPAATLEQLPTDGTRIKIAVSPTTHGTFTGPATADSSLRIEYGTGLDSPLITISGAPPTKSYLVEGFLGSVAPQVVGVYEAVNDEKDSELAEVTVEINGTRMLPKHGFHYEADLPPPSPGATLDLRVSGELGTVEATGSMPFAPSITQPVTGRTFTSDELITFKWTTAEVADRYVLQAVWYPSEGPGARLESFPIEDPASLEVSIPTDRLPTDGTEIIFYIYAYNDGAFTGEYASGSRMNIRGPASNTVNINVMP